VKLPFDKRYLKLSLHVFAVAAAIALFTRLLDNLGVITSFIGSFFGFLTNIFTPFIYGFFIAYFMNVPVSWLETKAFGRIPRLARRGRLIRILSVTAVYIALLASVTWALVFLIPEIAQNASGLAQLIQTYIVRVNSADELGALPVTAMLSDAFDAINKAFGLTLSPGDIMGAALEPVSRALASLPQVAGALYQETVKVASALSNSLLGLIVAFYMLCEKESAATIAKKLCYIVLRRRRAEKVIGIAREANGVFVKFLIGKALDSAVMGMLFFTAGSVAGLPMMVISSLILGVTNMIPYFGPIFGTVPILLITLMADPAKALWAFVIILVLQQFDGFILGPRILGESTGVKPMGVIFAIIVGGALFGLPGMLFGVPVFAMLQTIAKEMLNKKYNDQMTDTGEEKKEDGEEAGRKEGIDKGD
jgi:predicted PurR-regulated permease PerM